jgi:hypothetical protein
VAGSFYPAEPAALRAAVASFLVDGRPAPARLLFVPHAGYVYSGRIAGAGYAGTVVPPLVVVLAPNHHGIGAPLALPRAGTWRTPLGDLAVDEAASRAVAARCPLFEDDWRAHSRDHALEVQLPFLQVLRGADPPTLVTISVGTYDRAALLSAGAALARGLADAGVTRADQVLLIVSSDMSHYLPAARARELDLPVLELLRTADAEGLHERVTSRRLSVCGAAPAVVALAAARELGVAPGRVVRYGHSGEVTGDDSDVVAYASVLLPAN